MTANEYLTQVPNERLQTILRDAQDAFWAVIAERIETESGDFGPSESHWFDGICEQAVTLWLYWNINGMSERVEELRNNPAQAARETCYVCGKLIGDRPHAVRNDGRVSHQAGKHPR